MKGTLNFQNVSLDLTAGLPQQLIKSGLPQIAFSGRSNVGKSSLVNMILNRKKLARVSSEPGKTITANYYKIDNKLFLVDLPGYGFAKRSKESIKKWSEMTQTYFEENDALKLVFQLADIRIGLTEDDMEMLDYLNYYLIPYVLIATKCDKPNKTELENNYNALKNHKKLINCKEIILSSAQSGMGRDAVIKSITSLL